MGHAPPVRPAGRRLADSHLASPTAMHAVGPPPFPRWSEVMSARPGQARGLFAPPAPAAVPRTPARGLLSGHDAGVGQDTAGPRLPRHAAAPAGPRGGHQAGARHARGDLGRRPADRQRRQHLHHLPGAGTARAARPGDPHPPGPRRAPLPPGRRGRARAPGLHRVRPDHRGPARGRRAPGVRAGRQPRLPDRRRAPDRVRPVRVVPRGRRRAAPGPPHNLESWRARCSPGPARSRHRESTPGSPPTTGTRTRSSGRWPARPAWWTARTGDRADRRGGPAVLAAQPDHPGPPGPGAGQDRAGAGAQPAGPHRAPPHAGRRRDRRVGACRAGHRRAAAGLPRLDAVPAPGGPGRRDR